MQDAALGTMMAARGFLTDIHACDARLPDMVLLAGRYDMDHFTPDLFDALGIVCPASLLGANPRRRAEFLAGRALAKAGLGMIGVSYADIAIGTDRRPQWPDTVAGSISHARGHVACLMGVGIGGHPGIDIETIAHGQPLAAIAKIALTAAERAQIDPLPQDQAARVATLIFSGKEALFKALFPMVGKPFGFAAAEMAGLPDTNHLALRLTADLAPTLGAGRTFALNWDADAGHVMTWLVARDDRLMTTAAAIPDHN